MITSKENHKAKHIKKLLASSKYRREEGAYILENQLFIEDILDQNPENIIEILHAIPLTSIKDKLHPNTITTEVTEDVFQTLPSVKQSFGALAICRIKTPTPPKEPDTILFLDTIGKPNNLGAILRNAAAFSCSLIALSPNSCDPYNPEAIRASAGHLQKTPVINASLKELLFIYPNLHIYTLDSNSKQSLSDITIKKPALFIFGSENGISDETEAHINEENRVKIDIHPLVDSLNVAATTAIVLYEIQKK